MFSEGELYQTFPENTFQEGCVCVGFVFYAFQIKKTFRLSDFTYLS